MTDQHRLPEIGSARQGTTPSCLIDSATNRKKPIRTDRRATAARIHHPGGCVFRIASAEPFCQSANSTENEFKGVAKYPRHIDNRQVSPSTRLSKNASSQGPSARGHYAGTQTQASQIGLSPTILFGQRKTLRPSRFSTVTPARARGCIGRLAT